MRPKDKIEKYIERYMKCPDLKMYESTLSRYYCFNGRKIRVSDHVSSKSDGDLHIILDSADRGNYIVYVAANTKISVLTYNEVKQMIRCMNLVPSFITALANKPCELTSNELKTLDVKPEDTVLGVPVRCFTNGQLNIIKATAKKQKTLHNL